MRGHQHWVAKAGRSEVKRFVPPAFEEASLSLELLAGRAAHSTGVTAGNHK